MKRFQFSINVNVVTTKYTALQLQELLVELIIVDGCEDERLEKVLSRIQGMTVNVSPVQAVKPSPQGV